MDSHWLRSESRKFLVNRPSKIPISASWCHSSNRQLRLVVSSHQNMSLPVDETKKTTGTPKNGTRKSHQIDVDHLSCNKIQWVIWCPSTPLAPYSPGFLPQARKWCHHWNLFEWGHTREPRIPCFKRIGLWSFSVFQVRLRYKTPRCEPWCWNIKTKTYLGHWTVVHVGVHIPAPWRYPQGSLAIPDMETKYDGTTTGDPEKNTGRGLMKTSNNNN